MVSGGTSSSTTDPVKPGEPSKPEKDTNVTGWCSYWGEVTQASFYSSMACRSGIGYISGNPIFWLRLAGGGVRSHFFVPSFMCYFLFTAEFLVRAAEDHIFFGIRRRA